MRIINTKEPVLLGIGDVLILIISLYVTLALRYQNVPSVDLILSHVLPFSIIFVYSILALYISGLYGRIITLARASIPGTILRVQFVNIFIAVLLFYFIPSFSVTPKTNLFIYAALSTVFLILWRIGTYSIFSLRRKANALVIGAGPEVEELINEMSLNPRVGLRCEMKINPAHVSTYLASTQQAPTFQYIVADLSDNHLQEVLPEIYRRFFPQIQIIDIHDFYETVFSRIPLSRMNYAWIMSRINSKSSRMFDFSKRCVDMFFGIIVGIAMCIAYPFVAIAIKIEDKGPIFIPQQRIGRNNKLISIYKFRSMQQNDAGKWLAGSENKVTRVGRIIRKTSIDELPQALAILKGDISLVGPRTDIINLGKTLEQEIPYYSIRTVITPGLVGWAQINQEKPPQSIEETKLRLSYDLYYITHRSFGLDLQIILRTVKTLLSRVGM